jgi:uncharacterized protein with HEPN domain
MEHARKFNTALGCLWKHYNLALGHTNEAELKIARECKDTCEINPETRQEVQDAVRNLLLAEEHLNELINKTEDMKVREIMWKLLDETREVRQRMVLTNLAFRAELPVDINVKEEIPKLAKRIDMMLKKVEEYASDIDINANLPKCDKCDAEFGELMKAMEKSGRSYIRSEEVYAGLSPHLSPPLERKTRNVPRVFRPLAGRDGDSTHEDDDTASGSMEEDDDDERKEIRIRDIIGDIMERRRERQRIWRPGMILGRVSRKEEE